MAASAASAFPHTLAYAGDVKPADAWQQLQALPNAILVDVRTAPEWHFNGAPNLAALGKEAYKISWKLYPGMEANLQFTDMVRNVAPATDTPIYFICRTGGRSREAAIAMTTSGYTQCYNVSDGFEGDRNHQGQRGTVTGWKASGLPWEQA